MPSMEQCPEIREEIRKLCRKYPDEYWRKLDKDDEYPEHFVQELTDAGWSIGRPSFEAPEAKLFERPER